MATPLYINTSNLDSINGVIREALDKVSHAFDKSDDIQIPNAISPHLIAKALKQFLEVLYRVDHKRDIEDEPPVHYYGIDAQDQLQDISREDISELGNHGLQLLDNLSEWAQALQLHDQHYQIRAIMVMVALWVARHGGELNAIETIVNTMAEIANSTSEQEALAELSYMMGELINAVSAETKFDFDNVHRQHPWRILNLNRGIIATRSHDTQIMEIAFDELIRNIPEDAEMFFHQGMQQMEELNYPDHVRDVVLRYYQQSKTRVLH